MAKIRDGRQAKFYWIENRVLLEHGSRMGMAGIAVYNVLALFANEQRRSFPSYETIRRYTGMSRKTIAAALKVLVELGLLKIRRRLRGGQRQSSVYTLVDPPEQEPLASDQDGGRGSHPEPHGSHGEPRKDPVRGSHPELRSSQGELELDLPIKTTAASAGVDEYTSDVASLAAVAAGEGCPKPEGQPTTARAGNRGCPERDQGPADAPVIVPTESAGCPPFASDLQARGLPAGLAYQFGNSVDPGLLQEAIAYCDERRPTLTNPVGALRSMVEHPDRWGFARTAAGWKRPSGEGDCQGQSEIDPLAAATERARRDRAARRHLYGLGPVDEALAGSTVR